jgi:cytochrome c-type biogenesis protein CcmH
MTTFWIIATGFIFIALAFVIPPLLRKSAHKTAEVDAQKANITIYKERLAALQQEGLNAAQFAAAKLELDTLLSQDIAENIAPNSQVRARWVSILVILFIPALAVGGYFKYGNPNLINPMAAESPHNNAHGQMPKDFQAMVAKLEQRLQEKPDDSQGWQMLGRSYAMLEDYPKALQAYHKVLALGGDKDAQILADTAELSALTNDGQLAGQPSLLIKSALDIDANNEKALWLSGVAATQRSHFAEAIQIWEHLLTIFPAEETESRTVIQQQIAEAQAALHKSGSGQVVEFASPNTATAEPLAQPPTLVAAPKITVHVSLDPALQATVKPTDTLFIYAKATSGPAMPLAIVKKMASDLPLTVTLDDSSAMTPAMKLSKFKQVSVFARISNSGSAMPQTGDLQGQQTPVANDAPDIIEIQINQVVP